jgi:hypothetical protein
VPTRHVEFTSKLEAREMDNVPNELNCGRDGFTDRCRIWLTIGCSSIPIIADGWSHSWHKHYKAQPPILTVFYTIASFQSCKEF